jgi:O-antigen/teichoic acid export membrane protein
MVDQGLSTGTNFVLLFVMVRNVSVAAFGSFSLVYVLYMLVIPLLRTTATVPFTVRHVEISGIAARDAAAESLRYVFSVGLCLGALCLGLAAIASDAMQGVLVVIGLAFPFLLVQDAVRGLLFARQEFDRAAWNDAVWAGVQLTGLVSLVLLRPGASVVQFALTWALGGFVAALVGLLQLNMGVWITSPLHWWRDYTSLARPLFLAMLFTVLPAQLTYLIMPAVSTLEELGRVRGAYVLFGPLNVAFTAAATVALPHAVQVGTASLRGMAAKLSAAMGGLALAWLAALLLVPSAVGDALLPGIWGATRWVRLFLALSLVAEGVLVGPNTALSALQLPARLARIRYVTGPVTLFLGVVLARNLGATGVGLAFAIGYSATAAAAWLAVPTADLHRGMGRP